MPRQLPANVQAERFVIAAALADTASAKFVLTSLKEEDFTINQYRYIFGALEALNEREAKLDITSVASMLVEQNYFDEVGGTEMLSKLLDDFISSEGLDENINILLDKTSVRNLILKFEELENEYYAKAFDSDVNFLGVAEGDINKITSNRRVSGFRNLKEISVKVKQNINEAKLNGSNLVGCDTGFPYLNKITLGFGKGEMIVLAARPSVGKTALGVNIAYNSARSSHKPVLFFSLEMSDVSIGTRILSAVSNIPSKNILTGNISGQNLIKIDDSINNISTVPLYIDNTPGINISDIITKTRKFKANNPNLSMIVVDYLGLITPDRKYENKRIEIGAISHLLKGLATELAIPVVVISQLSRSVEQRNNKRPELQDLRESGDIEQDADKVLLLYREDYYDNDMMNKRNEAGANGENKYQNNDQPAPSQPQPNEASGDGSPSMVEVYVAKNRNGETNRAFLWFFKSYSRFNEPDKASIDSYKALHKL
jgi:replicative DNA helicase